MHFPENSDDFKRPGRQISLSTILYQADARDILTMVLPVIGTWVGTVLAFYFAKDNLLAATQSTKELLGLKERLKKIPIDSAMLRFGDPKVLKKQLAAGEAPLSLKLLDLSKLLRDAGRNRLPVLKADGAPSISSTLAPSPITSRSARHNPHQVQSRLPT